MGAVGVVVEIGSGELRIDGGRVDEVAGEEPMARRVEEHDGIWRMSGSADQGEVAVAEWNGCPGAYPLRYGELWSLEAFDKSEILVEPELKVAVMDLAAERRQVWERH